MHEAKHDRVRKRQRDVLDVHSDEHCDERLDKQHSAVLLPHRRALAVARTSGRTTRKGTVRRQCAKARVASVGAFLLALVTHGCGASYQVVYDGEVQFERCFRLDEDDSFNDQQRLQCWRSWSRDYVYGQTRDRVEYALRRQRELTSTTSNTGQASQENATTQPFTSSPRAQAPIIQAPQPVNALTAPPSVQENLLAAPPTTESQPRTTRSTPPPAVPPTTTSTPKNSTLQLPASGKVQQCVVECLTVWQRCSGLCEPRHSTSCTSECNASHQTCTAGCFTNDG